MKYLSKEQIINLHSIAIKKTGGIDGLRDNGLLESAINSPCTNCQQVCPKDAIHYSKQV
jgi:prophage maintenance system killer protein